MQGSPVVAIGGENLIDSVQSFSSSGEEQWTHNLGGSPYNVAVAMARQGVTPHYITPISTDAFGDRLAQHLTSQGVVLSGGRNDFPTTQAVVTLRDGVPNYLFHRENTAERAVTVECIAAAIPSEATHFHVGSLALIGGKDAESWEAAFHAAAKNGLTTSLDPNIRASLVDDPSNYRARIFRLLRSSTIVKLSDEDLSWLYPETDQLIAIQQLVASCTAGLIVLTKGPEGADCWTSTLKCSLPNPHIPNLVDTIGAGDTFMGSLLSWLAKTGMLSAHAISRLNRDELEELLRYALQAACLNCMQEGCDPPTEMSIQRALAEGII